MSFSVPNNIEIKLRTQSTDVFLMTIINTIQVFLSIVASLTTIGHKEQISVIKYDLRQFEGANITAIKVRPPTQQKSLNAEGLNK